MSAQDSPKGVPKEMIEAKKMEIKVRYYYYSEILQLEANMLL